MAITAQNISYSTSAPVAAGSGILAFGGSSQLEFSYVGTATFTGDGSTTNAIMNFIDGSNALPWTPVSCVVVRTGGNAAATIVSYANVLNNIAANVIFSAAPGNNASISYAVFVLKS